MSSSPVLHHAARGIHPAAFVGPAPPFTWHAAWDNATAYVVTDAVSQGGSNYICILANTNQMPPNVTYWASLDLQDHVLWIDTSSGPPCQLKMWDAATPGWLDVGSISSVSGGGTVGVDCLTFPNGAVVCNPSIDVVTLATPTGEHQWDVTGYTLPDGHRLERA
jgi:hypothetical protein